MESPQHGRRARRPFRWQERMRRAIATRRIFPFLILITAGLAVLSGFLVTLIDRKVFPTFGTGIWWAIVTLGTVGYGDVVPHSAWGRVVGSVVIIVGVTFLSFLIATVTSYFVSVEQAEADTEERERVNRALIEARETVRRSDQHPAPTRRLPN